MSLAVRSSFLVLLVFGFTTSSIGVAVGQVPSQPGADQSGAQDCGNEPVRGQPLSLFNGTSLEGWETLAGTKPKNWSVVDGAISWKSKGGDLYHQQWFRDFELSFQWKLNANGNSGVKYRVQRYGKRSLGCEYQIQDDKNNLFGKTSTGALYAVFEPDKKKVINPLGQWNDAKIVVCGNRVEHWVNGIKVVEATIGSPDWHTRIAKSKFSKHEQFGLNREGRIFLQDHGKPVWFRKIIVTPLDCDQAAATESAN